MGALVRPQHPLSVRYARRAFRTEAQGPGEGFQAKGRKLEMKTIEFVKPILELVRDPNQPEDEFYAKLKISPLDRGYGMTIGNSLRRVLLSSITLNETFVFSHKFLVSNK